MCLKYDLVEYLDEVLVLEAAFLNTNCFDHRPPEFSVFKIEKGLGELCREIVTENEQNQGASYNFYKNLRLVESCQEIVGLPTFTANQLNGSPTTSTDTALFDSMFNSSYLEFEENQSAPIMPLCIIPYNINPANRSIRKKSKTKIKKPTKPPNAFIFFRKEKLQEIKEIIPNITQGDASKIISLMWRNEPLEERLNFEKKLQEVKEIIPNITLSDAFKIISLMWRNEPSEERLKFEKKAEEAKNKHIMKYPEYYNQQKPKG
ncbi:3349_t:CDS:2, partial [Dentiscutata erythropus]